MSEPPPGRRRRPRLADIAIAAGVGVATVERVLNARGNVSPDTARRVLMAAQRLGVDRPIPALHRGAVRVEVILVRPDSAFFARLNHAFRDAAAAHDRSLTLYRSFLHENTPEEIGRRIEAVMAEREAMIVVVQNDPRIVEALRVAAKRGVPVVLLVSDVVADGVGATYVGIDNESAGRTAGYLLRQSLGGRRGTVMTLSHSGRYVTHRQRVVGFSQYFADLDDELSFQQCLVTGDDDETTYEAVGAALLADPRIVGIYHAGGGNAGAVRALRQHRRRGEVAYIGHELTPATRAFLQSGAMLFAIDQEPELQVARALDTVQRLIGLKTGAPEPAFIPFRIVTPENCG